MTAERADEAPVSGRSISRRDDERRARNAIADVVHCASVEVRVRSVA